MATEQSQSRPVSARLPLGAVLNGPEENRDSAYYSSTDASSKHNSTASGVAINVFQPGAEDKTPSPTAVNVVSPTGNMSVASIVSPTSPGAGHFDRPTSLDSVHGLPHPGQDSRRESVDSRMNQNFGQMRLGGSPYASQNHSTTSIQGSLAQQRNPRAGLDQLSAHRISNGYQPSMDRTPDAQSKATRTAPAITGPATGHIARAAEPIKGQAWAFPEDDDDDDGQSIPSAAPTQNFLDSRRSSLADSIASSQFTSESRLPPGQRRLDDQMGPDFHHRLSVASAEYPSVHHHSLQHKQLSDIHSEESSPHNGNQPYSRTPELRVSHKLAERKRRTEMKELFEQLRDLMPQERGSKASKWEILSKAITEHQKLIDNSHHLDQLARAKIQENEYLRRELDMLRQENTQLRGGSSAPAQSQPRHSVSSQAAPGNHYNQDPYSRDPRPELPPLRALSGQHGPSAAESMTGVQYESQRSNGYQ